MLGRRMLAFVFLITLFAGLAPVSGAVARDATDDGYRARVEETVVTLRSPVLLADIAPVLSRLPAPIVSIEHTGASRGGFLVGQDPIDVALRRYREAHTAAGLEGAPRIFLIRLAGDVSRRALARAGLRVRTVLKIPAGTTVAAIGRGRALRVVGDGEPAPGRARIEGVSARTTTGGKDHAWMPDRGTIEGIEGSSGMHIIHQTLEWVNSGPDQTFLGNHAFEHDLKLYDDGAPSDDDWHTPGLWPGCDSNGETGDFWVQRDDDLYWSTNYPDGAGPYFDNHWDDPCSQMDLTIGVYTPRTFEQGVEYHTYVTDPTPAGAGPSEFHLGVSSVENDCGLLPNDPTCVGANTEGGSDTAGALITRCAAYVLPSEFSWTAMDAPEVNSCYEQRLTSGAPVGYWRLDDVGTAVVRAGTGVAGEYSGNVQLGRQGALRSDTGRAAGFQGGVASIPHYAALDVPQASAEAWVRTNTVDPSVTRTIMRRAGIFRLSMQGGKASAAIAVTDGTTSTTISAAGITDLHDGRWHHVAFTYDGVSLRLYVDGALEKIATFTGGIVPGPTVGLTIGNSVDSTPFMGDVDEAAFYAQALPQSDFEARFARRWAPRAQCTGSSAYAQLICASRPFGYWRLDEQSGAVAKDLTSLQNGSYGTAVTLGKPRAVGDGSAIHTSDGSTGVVTIPYEPYGTYAAPKVTAEAWIRTNTLSSTTRTIVRRPGVFRLSLQGGKAYGAVAVTDGATSTQLSMTGTTDLHDGRWHHVALTYDGTTSRLFVDGAQQGTGSFTGRLADAPNVGLTVGNSVDSTPFMGEIDEVAVYGHALGASDFTTRFSHRWTPTPQCTGSSSYAQKICGSGPMGYWRLDEQSGTAAHDLTSLQHGAYGAAVTLGKPGAVGDGSAVHTGGTPYGVVTIPYEPYGTYSTRKVTAEAWIKTGTAGTGTRTILRRAGVYRLSLSGGKASVVIAVTDGSTSTSISVTGASDLLNGSWHHVAMTYDGSTLRLFVDGVQQGTAAFVGRLADAPNVGLTIGNGGDSTPFTGDIDEVAIYDHAVSPTAIANRI